MTALDVAEMRVDRHGAEWMRAYIEAIESAKHEYPDLGLQTLFSFQQPYEDRALFSTVLIQVPRIYRYVIPKHLQLAIATPLGNDLHFLFVAITGGRGVDEAARHLVTALSAGGLKQVPRRHVVRARQPGDLREQVLEAIREVADYLPSLASRMTQVERDASHITARQRALYLTPKVSL